MCTHKVDIPYNAIVEVVLVDEGNFILFYLLISMGISKTWFFKEILIFFSEIIF